VAQPAGAVIMTASMSTPAAGPPLSVLFVTAMYPHAERPGNGAFVAHQAEQLRALGHRVDVVHVKGYESRWNYLIGAWEVLRATWSGRHDLVHVHYGLTGLCALLRWRTPMVVTLHGSDMLQGRLHPFVSRCVSAMAHSTIAVSPAIASRAQSTLIPCGVDLERFRPVDRADARSKLGLAPEGKYVLFPFDPRRRVKRYDLAEAAVALLRDRGVVATLLPVWNATNDLMPLYYSAADVMILCSDSEGSPTSVKEALACNLPVVSTDVGDVSAILQGVDGAETCERRPAAIADALARVLHRPSGAFDGRSAMSRYDQRSTVEALVGVYCTVLRRVSAEKRR
jgi:glycosyltransferase involved in cell wall biosynthesis